MLHTPKLPPDILAHYSLLCDNIMCSPHYSLLHEDVLHSLHISSNKCHSFTDERGWGESHLAVYLRFWSVKTHRKTVNRETKCIPVSAACKSTTTENDTHQIHTSSKTRVPPIQNPRLHVHPIPPRVPSQRAFPSGPKHDASPKHRRCRRAAARSGRRNRA